MTQLVAEPEVCDYSLIGSNGVLAIEKGLAEADWYQCDVPRETMRQLLERRDGPAIRDTILWFALLFGSAYLTWRLWGTWWAILPYFVYSVIFATTSDSRWHETGHGTAFKTDWMNNALYEIASFMVMREATVWRWSHNRHHSDTIIVGRDPEIAVPRPPTWSTVLKPFFAIQAYPMFFGGIPRHFFGSMSEAEKTYIPESQFSRIYWTARIYVLIFLAVIATALYERSILPLLFVGFVNLFGSWLMPIYGHTQHAGLAENVLDHRLNCRTVYMNFIHRYLYWNMNYHVEHHMFPLVPYHALPRLHAAVKDDCPTPYPDILTAWREILPAVRKQMKDPTYYVKRKLPLPKTRVREAHFTSESLLDAQGWVAVCASGELQRADAIRFDYVRKTYAIYRNEDGKLYATDGLCTHGNTHLADGLVKDGMIECPKHNGRFHLADGSPARAPICRGLATYPVEEVSGGIRINIARAAGVGARAHESRSFRVVSNRSVSTFIRELTLEPANGDQLPSFTPGDYLQFDIPAYEEIRFRDFDIPEPYRTVWERQHVFDLVARNPERGRRNNYSLACDPHKEGCLRFNVRIATPPPGQDCLPGAGSSYVFSLRPGDIITAIGPFGDFHIKPTQREMVYIGGGAGMAPIRAHISHLLETEGCARKISYWYGARSRQEIFYADYFERLALGHRNFSFTIALSSPLPEDGWTGKTGFIHEVALKDYMSSHPNPAAVEYYLCGPPMMIRACTRMLHEIGVHPSCISYDEF